MAAFKFVTHVCTDEHEWAVAQRELAIIDPEMGANITEKTGITKFGPPIRVIIKSDTDETVGGVFGELFGGWLYISVLWVAKPLRNQGLGTKLMNRIEVEASKRGCTNAHLETFSFEAPYFYKRLGYEVFATLDDYPKGHSKCFLKKCLKT
ncbi:MAG: N-acetyltransferase [Candidatus Thorarchaeota archaeon]|nr:N-acetyltransferase [Candidatus Thorarchaeota archaeon]